MERTPEADEEGRRLLAWLQRSAWVDDDLDYEDVMLEVANGRNPGLAIARDRHQSSVWVCEADAAEVTPIGRLGT